MNLSFKTISTHCVIGLVCTLPILVGAETSALYTLSGVPGFQPTADESGSFTNFINTIYRMSIGFGAALAVLVILFEGIKYSLSDSFGVKAELKGKITMALGGLALLMGAFIFLEFINPDLTDLTIEDRSVVNGENINQGDGTVSVGEVGLSEEEEEDFNPEGTGIQ